MSIEAQSEPALATGMADDTCDCLPSHSVGPGSAVALLNARASRVDQRTVPHARWAGRLAGAAGKAEVEVPYGLAGRRDSPVLQCPHQVYSSAWRVRFETRVEVSWAGRETEAAVDALEEAFLWNERSSVHCVGLHRPPTKRPLLRRLSGSKAPLSRSMRKVAGPLSPHTPAILFTCVAARRITRWPLRLLAKPAEVTHDAREGSRITVVGSCRQC